MISRRYKAEIIPIRRKTLSYQSLNLIIVIFLNTWKSKMEKDNIFLYSILKKTFKNVQFLLKLQMIILGYQTIIIEILTSSV